MFLFFFSFVGEDESVDPHTRNAEQSENTNFNKECSGSSAGNHDDKKPSENLENSKDSEASDENFKGLFGAVKAHMSDCRVLMLEHEKAFDVIDLDPYG